jgi:hypothetical protein
MFYEPTSILGDQVALAIARKPTIGEEKELYLSSEPGQRIGSWEGVANGSGTYTADSSASLAVAGQDLHLVVNEELLGNAANPFFIVTGTDQADAALVGSGTFSSPSYARVSGYEFQQGIAVDVKVPATKLFKTVTNVTCNNVKLGGKVELISLPTEPSWQFIGCVESLTANPGTRPPHSIACGFKGSAFVVLGRTPVNTLEFTTKYFGVVDGVNRFAGRSVSARLDIRKAGRITTERNVYAEAVLGSSNSFPDSGDSTVTLNGEFARQASFFVR